MTGEKSTICSVYPSICGMINPPDPELEHCTCKERGQHAFHRCYGCGFKWTATDDEMNEQFHQAMREVDEAERQAMIISRDVFIR